MVNEERQKMARGEGKFRRNEYRQDRTGQDRTEDRTYNAKRGETRRDKTRPAVKIVSETFGVIVKFAVSIFRSFKGNSAKIYD